MHFFFLVKVYLISLWLKDLLPSPHLLRLLQIIALMRNTGFTAPSPIQVCTLASATPSRGPLVFLRCTVVPLGFVRRSGRSSEWPPEMLAAHHHPV